MLRRDEWTGTCCCPTGLINPTLSNLFCNPESKANDTDVFPTCCFVAATNIGLGFDFGMVDDDNDDDDIVVKERG